MGVGVPSRTPSYILGYSLKNNSHESETKSRKRKNY